jgi:hypothetical protein
MAPEENTSFVIVDEDEEETDFELVDVPPEVELIRVSDPVPGLVPFHEETGFVLVEEDEDPTDFVLVEDEPESSPDIVPVSESQLEPHRSL